MSGKMPYTKRVIPKEGPDFFPTPEWATHALMDNESFIGDTIWEPACGDGAMSKVMETYDYVVESSDLNENGYGETGVDFLKQTVRRTNIVTNPPYNIAQDFIEHALTLVDGKAAFLLRLAFLEGQNRGDTLYTYNPPTRVWVFSERVSMYMKNAVEVSNGGTTAYAWYVWDKKDLENKTEVRWLRNYKKRDYT